jgi:hypothetical protein
VAFDFKPQLAQPGDELDRAAVPLTEARKKLTLGCRLGEGPKQ